MRRFGCYPFFLLCIGCFVVFFVVLWGCEHVCECMSVCTDVWVSMRVRQFIEEVSECLDVWTGEARTLIISSSRRRGESLQA